MAINWHSLATPGVQKLVPYQPGKSLTELSRESDIREAIKLASNENPRGPAPRVRAVIADSSAQLSRYPDGHDLVCALAEKLAVSPNQITLGNGSNDVLDLIARIFLEPGRSAVVSEHCFLVYPIVVALAGGRLKETAATHYGHDLSAMLTALDPSVSLIFIANPNNPTGTWVTATELEDFLKQVPRNIVVVLDEAYLEYAGQPDHPDSLALLAKYENLVLTRTFSKAYGLASARVGYALSNADIADLLNRARQPFNVNGLALAAAITALDEAEYIARSVELNQQGLIQIKAGLDRLGLPYIATAGNFVSFNVLPGQRERSAADLYEALLAQGVIVRPVANYGLPDHLRVTTGLPEENERFLQALSAVL